MHGRHDTPERQALGLVEQFSQHPVLLEWLTQSPSIALFSGLSGSQPALLMAALRQHHGCSQLLLLPDHERAAYLHNDIERLCPGKEVLFFPRSWRKAYQTEDTDNANVLLRAEVLNRLSHTQKDMIVVTYPEALAEKVVNQRSLKKNTLEVKTGERLGLDFLLEMLVEYGFDRVDFVYEPGQFAIRGGIVDVFSFSNDYPFRIELFGDEIESIRTFDPETQLSVSKIAFFSLIPNLNTQFKLEQHEALYSFMAEDAVIWLEDFSHMKEKVDKIWEQAQQQWTELHKKQSGQVLQSPPEQRFLNPEIWVEDLLKRRLIFFGQTDQPAGAPEFRFRSEPQPIFKRNFNMLIDCMRDNTRQGLKNLFFTDTPRQAERLRSIFEDLKADVRHEPYYFSLHEGFVDHQLRLALFTDHQVFERYHKYKLRNYKLRSQALTLKELRELKKGDYVTHIDHGVGIFDGLERLEVNGKRQEAIRLIYRDNDLLYVSINSLHKIARFTGSEGKAPKMNKLGSDAWEKLKSKTKNKVKDIAKDLIQLYARRRAQKGFAFTPDSYLQTELEASFIYEDTPDQHKATAAVKNDMHKPYPMDRLVCGDVGFGKTEIAVRAAFKAVCDSKQVAVLVPTTILALQHYKTFSERLKDFPCKVDYLNRFRTATEQKRVLEKLEKGEIDILIGTHKIASKQVKFKDLGLLIIDEEQKFGVGVKERLKEIRVNVDTLTLTATPIPRTLQFSLMGARDLSVINTPPPNRQPVQTELILHDEEKIRDALMFELDRGGQAFVVHNRVANIKEIAGIIQRLCPDAKVCVGHGQMDGEELEEVLLDFIEGEYDILVATNIIESGLDIPNANTIIINSAHMFGLSDLHQMRGRVGRSNKKAFCYLMVPTLQMLTEDARKRLKAIEEFSDLGSGFQVAMRDLDIRGAGNLLGAEQSGFIADIGYEMFHKILDEAIQELQESEYKELFADRPERPLVSDCQIDTDFEALIPERYVSAGSERLSLYMELDNLSSEEALQEFREKLLDRFGPVPAAVDTLLNIVRIRRRATKLGMEKVMMKGGKFRAWFVNAKAESFYQGEVFGKVIDLVKSQPRRFSMKNQSNAVGIEVLEVPDTASAIRLLDMFLGG